MAGRGGGSLVEMLVQEGDERDLLKAEAVGWEPLRIFMGRERKAVRVGEIGGSRRKGV